MYKYIWLATELRRVFEVVSGRCLRSTAALVVPRTNRSAIGDRAFPVAAAT